jgi:hypothetical protein
LSLVSKLLDQSQFNRLAHNLRLIVGQLRCPWLIEHGATQQMCFLLDPMPEPVVGVKRSNRRSDFVGSTSYGYCASRSMKYFEYKLVAFTNLDGIPVAYDLVSAHTDDHEAADVVFDYLHDCQIIDEKGFVGNYWQGFIQDQAGNCVWTPKRRNQNRQNSKDFDHWLNNLRKRNEDVFHELINTERNLEMLLARTIIGLITRIIAKVTSHAISHLLGIKFNYKDLTFKNA